MARSVSPPPFSERTRGLSPARAPLRTYGRRQASRVRRAHSRSPSTNTVKPSFTTKSNHEKAPMNNGRAPVDEEERGRSRTRAQPSGSSLFKPNGRGRSLMVRDMNSKREEYPSEHSLSTRGVTARDAEVTAADSSLPPKHRDSRLSEDARKILARARSRSRRRTQNDLATELVDSLNQAFASDSSRATLRLKQRSRSQPHRGEDAGPSRGRPTERIVKKPIGSNVAVATQFSRATAHSLPYSPAQAASDLYHGKYASISDQGAGKIRHKASTSLWLNAPQPGLDERGNRLRLDRRYYVGVLPPTIRRPSMSTTADIVTPGRSKKKAPSTTSHPRLVVPTLSARANGSALLRSTPEQPPSASIITPRQLSKVPRVQRAFVAATELVSSLPELDGHAGSSIEALKRLTKVSKDNPSFTSNLVSTSKPMAHAPTEKIRVPPSARSAAARRQSDIGAALLPAMGADSNTTNNGDDSMVPREFASGSLEAKRPRGRPSKLPPGARLVSGAVQTQSAVSPGIQRSNGVSGPSLPLGIGSHHVHLTDSLFRVGPSKGVPSAKPQENIQVPQPQPGSKSKTGPLAESTSKGSSSASIASQVIRNEKPLLLPPKAVVYSEGDPLTDPVLLRDRPHESVYPGPRKESIRPGPRKESVCPGLHEGNVHPGPRRENVSTDPVQEPSVFAQVEALNNAFSTSSLGKRKASEPAMAAGWYLDPKSVEWKRHLPIAGGSHDPPLRSPSTPSLESQAVLPAKSTVQPKHKAPASNAVRPSGTDTLRWHSLQTPDTYETVSKYTDTIVPICDSSSERPLNDIPATRARSRSRSRPNNRTSVTEPSSIFMNQECTRTSHSLSRSRPRKQPEIAQAGLDNDPQQGPTTSNAQPNEEQQPRKQGRPRKVRAVSQLNTSTQHPPPSGGAPGGTDREDKRPLEAVQSRDKAEILHGYAHVVPNTVAHDVPLVHSASAAASLMEAATVEYQRREYLCAALAEAVYSPAPPTDPISLRFAGRFSELVDPAKDVMQYAGEVAGDVVNKCGLTLWNEAIVRPPGDSQHNYLVSYRCACVTSSSPCSGIVQFAVDEVRRHPYGLRGLTATVRVWH